jgi:alkylhydroperoxidase family enzyme
VIPAVEWAWQRQNVWSQTADKLKAGPSRLRAALLALTVVAAALALAGSQLKGASLPASVTLTVIAAVALAAVGLLRSQTNVEQVRRWTRARSVSEAIKTEVFAFLTQSGRYSGEDRETRLEAEIQRLEHESRDLLGYASGIQPRKRSLPAVHDVDTYLDVRVRESQLEKYYEPKAAELRRRIWQLKAVEVALALIAAGLAAVAALSPSVGAWAAVVTTAGGAVTAYIAAERYEFLWIEYSRTASELRRLLERRTAADGTALSGPELVAKCEDVISVQNQAWMAKWGGDDTDQASS